jgi:hypothetical protein
MSTSIKFKKLEEPEPREEPYGSLIGSLLYAQQKTRPDISFAVTSLARYNSGHEEMHWNAALKVLQYLKGTSREGLVYKHQGKWELEVDVDASYGTGFESKSITGYIIRVNGTAVAWRTAQQSVVATSTATAEYIALFEAMRKALWIKNIAKELGREFKGPTRINEDNEAVIQVANGDRNAEMVKHLAIKYHFVREQVKAKEFAVIYVPTDKQHADMMTKIAPRDQIVRTKKAIGLVDIESRADKQERNSGGALQDKSPDRSQVSEGR